MTESAARFRLRAFEQDWVLPLWERDESPIRSLLLAEAHRWVLLGQDQDYFAAGETVESLVDRPHSEFEDVFDSAGIATGLQPLTFAQSLLAAQDDLTTERVAFLEYVFFADSAEWAGRLEQLQSVPDLLRESQSAPSLADEVGWGLSGPESRIDEADRDLPAGWRSADLSRMVERIPAAAGRLAAVNRVREQISRVVNSLSRAEHQTPVVRDPLAAAKALVDAGLFDDAAVILEDEELEGGEEELLRGRIALQKSDLSGAETALESAADAGLGEGAYLLGRLLLDTGREADGERALVRAEELGNDRAAMALAEHLQEKGERDAALEAVKRAASVEDPVAILSLAGTLVLGDHPEEAATLLYGTGRFLPADGLLEIALMLDQKDCKEEAIVVLIEADIAGSTRAAPLLGQIHRQKGDLGAAETWLRKAVASGSTRSHLNLGNLLLARGDRDGAEEQFRLGLAAGDTGAHLNLGLVLDDRGNIEEARRAYEAAVEAEDVGGHVGLAGLLYRTGEDWGAAERHFAAASEAGRYEHALLFNQMLVRQGRLEEGRELMRDAAEHGVEGAWTELGALSTALGEEAEAQRAYEAGLDAEEGSAAYNLGVMLEGRNELEDARRAYEIAFELGFREAANNLGSLFLRGDQADEAEKWLNRAIEFGDPRGLISLGLLEARRGKVETAQAMVRAAIDRGEPAGLVPLARFLAQEGRDEAARVALNEAKERGIGPAWGSSARRLAAAGELDLAQAEAEEGWRRRDPLSGLILARIHRHAEDLALAESVARELLVLTREKGGANSTSWVSPPAGDTLRVSMLVEVGTSHALVELGSVLVAQERYDEAAVALGEAVEMGSGVAAYNLALLHRRRDDEEEWRWVRTAIELGESRAAIALSDRYAEEDNHEAAEAELKRAEELGFERVDAVRGEQLLRRGLLAAAERSFAKAVDGGAATSVDIFNLGYCRERREDFEGAAEMYERIVNEFPQAAHNLATVRDRLGDKEAAIAAYEIGVAAGKAESRTDLAATLMEVGRNDEAEAILTPLVMGGDALALDLANYGVLLERRGERMEAMTHFRRAAELDPRALINLGRCQIEEGELTDAVSTFRRALDQGVAEAALDLGDALRGLGRFRDAERSYRQAWEDGDARAALRLGFVSARLEHVAQEVERALSRFESPDLLFSGEGEITESGLSGKAELLELALD